MKIWVLFALSLLISTPFATTLITACDILACLSQGCQITVGSETYQLSNDIATSGLLGETCLTTTADSVAIDLNGHTITATSGSEEGIIVANNGVVVQNGTINAERGIELQQNTGEVSQMTINIDGDYGIYIANTAVSYNIHDNTITDISGGSSVVPIYSDSANNNIGSFNTLTSGGVCIQFAGNSNNLNFSNNTLLSCDTGVKSDNPSNSNAFNFNNVTSTTYWIDGDGSGNNWDRNEYHFANGSGAWLNYSATCTIGGSCPYADGGADVPFIASSAGGTISEFNLNAVDNSPYTDNQLSPIACGDTFSTPNTIIQLNTSYASSGTCFTIAATNITIDCQNNAITGSNTSNSYGIYSNQNETSILNCQISNFMTGIYLFRQSNSTIYNNSINITYAGDVAGNSQAVGIYLEGANYTNTTSNRVYSDSGVAIEVSGISYGSKGGIFRNNLAVSSGNYSGIGYGYEQYGMFFILSNFNNLTNNTGISNRATDHSYGLKFDQSHDNNLTNNTGISYGSNYALYSIGCGFTSSINNHNNSISNMYCEGGDVGILLSYSQDTTLTNFVAVSRSLNVSNPSSAVELHHTTRRNRVENGVGTAFVGTGIEIADASGGMFNVINNVTGTSKTGRGLALVGGASNNSIGNSTFASNGSYVVYIETSTNFNTLKNLSLSANSLSGSCLFLWNSFGNNISNISCTVATGTGAGIWLFYNVLNNTISNSTFSLGSGDGIYTLSSPSSISGNLFANNTFNTSGIWARFDNSTFNNTFLNNNITANIWVNTSQLGADAINYNIFNDSKTGNIYHFANGTPSWNSYNILDTDNNSYADTGADLPFSQTTVAGHWAGLETDGHPYTKNSIASLQCGLVLNASNMIYTLTQNLSATNGTCFSIAATANNITIDCAGFSIIGNSSIFNYAIYTQGQKTTIENCNIFDFANGFWLHSSANSTLRNDTLNTTSNNIRSDSASANASMSRIYGYTRSGTAITIDSSNDNMVSSCVLEASNWSASIDGINTNSQRTIVQSCDVQGFSGAGIHYLSSSNGAISNNTVNTRINGGLAVQFNAGSTRNNITNNTFYGQTSYAVINFGSSSTGNRIENNTLVASGIASSGAIYLTNNAGGNVISNNYVRTAISLATAMWLNVGLSNNIISDNIFITAGNGIDVLIAITAGNNTFYHNNFTNTSNYYVSDANGSNFYNTSIGGVAQGNFWPNVLNGSVIIYDNNADNWGDNGPGYPYNNTTSLGKLLGAITDYAPYTLQGPSSLFNLTQAMWWYKPSASITIGTGTNYTEAMESVNQGIFSLSGINNWLPLIILGVILLLIIGIVAIAYIVLTKMEIGK